MRPDDRTSTPYRAGSDDAVCVGLGDPGDATLAVGAADVLATLGDGDDVTVLVHERSSAAAPNSARKRLTASG
jgi:hypothetical protein